MKYTVIADSCCSLFSKDLNSEKIDFHVAPLTLILENEEFVDDENLDTKMFVEKMNAQKTVARSACPSPETYADIMRKGDNIIIVALSSKLSGTHASAMTAAAMIKEEFPQKKLFVLDSLLAAAGLDHLVLKVQDLIECGEYDFEGITDILSEYRAKTHVRFLLQDIGNLVKNGRMSKMVGKILSTAKIKLVCGDDGQGEIKKYAMSLGTRRGLQAMAELPAKDMGTERSEPITITHVHNEEEASFLRSLLESKFGFKNIRVRLMRGLSSLYSADKGIVIAYTVK